jgi:hypothetical protein
MALVRALGCGSPLQSRVVIAKATTSQSALGNYKPTNATSRLQQKAHDLEQLQAKNFDIAR